MEDVAASHSLDAYAVIAYWRQESGVEVLKELIELPTTFLAVHVWNLGEVYYDFFLEDGIAAAQTAWTNTLALSLNLHRDADDGFIQRVGFLRVEDWISLNSRILSTPARHRCDERGGPRCGPYTATGHTQPEPAMEVSWDGCGVTRLTGGLVTQRRTR